MSAESVSQPEERLPAALSADVDVVARARDGHRDAQQALFVQFRDLAYRVAYRISGRRADAMDIVQDAFIRAFTSMDRLTDDDKFKSWLMRIVSNKALDLLRSKRVRRAVSIEGGDEERGALQVADSGQAVRGSESESEDNVQRIKQAMSALPPDQHAAIALYVTGDMTYGEIAEALDIPLGTVMSRIHRARRQLKEWLSDLGSED